MLKLTKKTDYGLIALKHLAETWRAQAAACSAKDIAEAYDVPQEALAKILQRLVKTGFLVSHQGTHGGYTLARGPEQISAFEVIRAIDGPLFITACTTHKGECHQSSKCSVKEPLGKVNDSIREVLTRISVADMMDATPRAHTEDGKSAETPRATLSALVTLS